MNAKTREKYLERLASAPRWKPTSRYIRKLSEDDVRSIKVDLARGKSIASVAKEYGVANSTIQKIHEGKSWVHVQCWEAERIRMRRDRMLAKYTLRNAINEEAYRSCRDTAGLSDVLRILGLKGKAVEYLTGVSEKAIRDWRKRHAE